MKRILALILAVLMCMGMVTTAFAQESVETLWYGDEVEVEVAKGENGYNFLSVYPGRAYEMSNHMVSADGEHHDIPQTLVLAPADRDYTWTPDGLYSFGSSNYEVLYCCDAETGYEDGIYYKRLNLEDSNYYDKDAAASIRAIVTNSYPYVSVERMKDNLAREGFEGAEELTRAEIISAVQMAIWAYANDADELAYSRTFDVPSNSQWGTVFHDYTNEMNVWWETGKRKFSQDETVADRINALAEHLKGQTAVYAEKNQIIISSIEILESAPILEQEGVYRVLLQAKLNNSGSSEQDELFITVSVDGEVVKSEAVALGTEVYEFMVEAEADQLIEVVVSGSQVLPEGAYFYEPMGGRDISQSLVGVAEGVTEVYASAETLLTVPEEVFGNLVIRKTDELGNGIAGAEFTLYYCGEEEICLGTYAVDANGLLEVGKLAPGSYRLAETLVPNGYMVPKQDIAFVIDDNGTVTVEESETVSMDNGTMVIVNEAPHAAVVLTLDMSGTMYRYKMDGKRYVDVAKAKALDFVNGYANSSENNGKRMLAIACFDTDAKVVLNWVDVSTAAGLSKAQTAIKNMKVVDNGNASSNYVCTNFDGGVILTRNMLKQSAVQDIGKKFAILLSDGAPTVTVNADTDTVGTIKSAFWGNQLRADGTKYQNARCGGGWTHPAEVDRTLGYLATGANNVADLTCSYKVDGEEKEGIFIVGVGGDMGVQLFYDCVYGTRNGTRTTDVKKKPAVFNYVDALEGYSQAEIMKMTTGQWLNILADRIGGTYESAANSAALQAQFDYILEAIKDTTY